MEVKPGREDRAGSKPRLPRKARKLTEQFALWALAVSLTAGLTGCGGGAGDNRTAKERLGLAVAGLRGSDFVRLKGTSVLTVGGEQRSVLQYGGQLEHHDLLRLYPLLAAASPEAEGQTAGKGSRALARTGEDTNAATARLMRKDGAWQVLESEGDAAPLPSLNPVAALEELESLQGEASFEAGAGPGVIRVRVRLTPEEARAQLKGELDGEMKRVRSAAEDRTGGTAGAELEKLWERENAKLQQRLAGASVDTVYRLDIDSRRSLPKRLSRTRTVGDAGGNGSRDAETEVSVTDFDHYQ